ncbi:MAG: alcohol dehydrogenase catalytic domain-containing protein [Mycobacteriales bacterium]
MSAAQGAMATFEGGGVITIGSAPIGARPPELVRIAVELCALCGSDKRLLRAGAAITPGHEIAGTVLELPEQSAGLHVGQRVLVYIPLYCGECELCAAGQTNRCLTFPPLVGWQRPGGFGTILDLPARNLIAVPQDIDPVVSLLALDTIGTAAHGVGMCERALGGTPERAAVVGCGPLGLGAIAVLRDHGATVVASDPAPARRAVGGALGAVVAAPAEAIRGTDAAGVLPARGFPLVVEASGSTAGRESAQWLVRPGGAVLLLGESDEPVTFPATPRWRRTDVYTVRSFYFPLTEVAGNFALLRRIGPRLAASMCTLHDLSDLQSTFERFVAGELVKPVIALQR